ncbi:hypothetical protein [Nocardioides sp.]|uniref:hypothetical protein n=1 Tax=Nocardioides sp. TaxID=35761 RepID=UPI00272718EA|nr:hypothetical protein [Nocardioides sp.]MDO9455008.1 hypothetical protein [Nocardioides sp.]
MARRVSLPAADDLFRPTVTPGDADPAVGKPQGSASTGIRSVSPVADLPDDATDAAEAAKKRASGRIKHDEKMTVYVTSAELIDLERTRLELRAEHGLAVDRGRLVREAIDLVLADFHEHGADSMLVRGLLDE